MKKTMNNNNIFDIIGDFENKDIEFKRSFRWNTYKNSKEKNGPKRVTREICAFLNSLGGTLFLGVEDDGTIVGVEGDIRSYNKKHYNKGKDLFLTDIGEKIRKHIGIKVNNYYDVKFKQIGSYEIVEIEVRRYKEPILHFKRDFVVRITNSSKNLLSKKEIYEYIQKEFGKKFRTTREFDIYFLSLMGIQKLSKIIIEKGKEIYYSLFLLLFISGILSITFLILNTISGPILLTVFLILSGIFGYRYSLDANKELKKGFGNKMPDFLVKTNLGKNSIWAMIISTLFLFIIAFGGLVYIMLIDVFNILIFSGIFLVFSVAYYFSHKRLKFLFLSFDKYF